MKKKEGIDYELGKVVGPWVFGLYMSPTRHRFYVVHDRNGDELLPLVHENVELGSTIVSDKWAAYNRLSLEGYIHETVDHSKNFKMYFFLQPSLKMMKKTELEEY